MDAIAASGAGFSGLLTAPGARAGVSIPPYRVALVLTATLITTFAAIVAVRSPDADFTIFYASARQILLGGDPYASGLNLNAPVINLIFLPFAFASMRVALLLWEAAGVVALLLAARAIVRTAGSFTTIEVAALVLVSEAGAANIMAGQVGFLAMLVCTLAWLLDRRGEPVAAGAVLGPLVYAKPFLLVFVVYFAIRRQLRAVAALLVTAAAVAGLGFAVFGAAVHASWLSSFGNIGWQAKVWNASIAGVLTRAFVGAPWIGTPPVIALTPSTVAHISVVLLTVASIAAVVRLRRANDRDAEWAAVLLLGILGSPLGWVYYLPLAAGPMVALWCRAAGLRARALACTGYALLCVRKVVMPRTTMSTVTAVLVGSAYFWSTLALFAFVLIPVEARRPASTVPSSRV